MDEQQNEYFRKRDEQREKDTRKWKERQEKWDEQREKDALEWKKLHEKTDRAIRRAAKVVGDLGDRFGEMIEHMVMPALVKKFRELGFVFTKAYPEAEYKDEANNIITEVDITLENGDKVMLLKSNPNQTQRISKSILCAWEKYEPMRACAMTTGYIWAPSREW